ncbi:MAG: hypothetical protein ACE14Q_04470 [Acidobacteriota bacterium]
MPHIKFEPKIDLKGIWKEPPSFEYTISSKDISFKYDGSYLEKSEKEVMFKYVVVEGRLVQNIFVSLIDDGEFYLLKLKRNNPVMRTEGIKILLSIIGCFIEKKGSRIIFSSLEPYKEEASFYSSHIFR